MAWLKAESWNRYRTNDKRAYHYGRPEDQETEADLRAKLAEGGKCHSKVVEGGWWWKRVRHWTAERDGETELVAEMTAEHERQLAALEAELSLVAQAR